MNEPVSDLARELDQPSEHVRSGPPPSAPIETAPVVRPVQARSGLVDAVAIITYLLGVFELIYGIFLWYQARGLERLGGGHLAGIEYVLSVLTCLLGLLMLFAGIGVQVRSRQGRELALAVAGFAALIGLASLLQLNYLGFAVNAVYTSGVFLILLYRPFAAEFRPKLGPAAPPGWRFALVLGGVPLMLLLCGGGVYLYLVQRSLPPLVAVVPLSTQESPELQRIAEVFAAQISMQLADVRGLRVVPQSLTRARAAERGTTNLLALGSDLRASLVLTVTVTTQGNVLVTTAELIDASSGELVWGKQYISKPLQPDRDTFLGRYRKGEVSINGIPETSQEIVGEVQSKVRELYRVPTSRPPKEKDKKEKDKKL
jgi:TolB-like protein